jgi:mannose-6-phosphate isomerase-like protein (cupin superfamily)
VNPKNRGKVMREVTHLIEDPSICVVRIRKGERISGKLAEMLNPVAPNSFHEFRLPANAEVELHYHDFDEYWLFTSGNPLVTLRSRSGVMKKLNLEPGDMVACVRGVEHTLWSDEELVYFQFSSVLEGDERGGHLTR